VQPAECLPGAFVHCTSMDGIDARKARYSRSPHCLPLLMHHHAAMRAFLEDLAHEAGAIAREHFRHIGRDQATTKGARDYVSHVDSLIERTLTARIRARFPDHAVLGEEGTGDRACGNGPLWIIDPIDGTTNFLRGIASFAISIAYCERDAEPVFGAIYDPIADELFLGERDAGLLLNGETATCSGCKDIGDALMATGIPFRVIEPLDDALGVLAGLQRRCDDHRRGGSAALDLAYVAIGRLDAYWELGIYSWDTAAGELLVRCGGGVATDFLGRTGELRGRRSLVAAASAELHRDVLSAVQPLTPWLQRPPYRQ
jgi:myo-inositol-1(or 4)-monophosphatase